MRISSGNNNEGLDPEIIPWSTNDAPFLPFYIGGILFTLFVGIPHLVTPYPYLAVLPALATVYLVYKTFRAIEAHRNLKRLDRLYEELKAKR